MNTSEHINRIRIAAESVRASLNTDVYVWNGPLEDGDVDELLYKIVPTSSSALLILMTYGGAAEAAYRICRKFHRKYAQFDVCVPTSCKSAGTLLVLGAKSIYMGENGELGPLDVQVAKKDELFERDSGLTLFKAVAALRNESLEFFEKYFLSLRIKSRQQISTRVASQIAERVTIGCMSPLFDQIDPMRIGEMSRNMAIAEEYGTRLASKYGNLKSETLGSLIQNYPSHDFIIDFDETRDLFERVYELDDHTVNLLNCLGPIVTQVYTNKVVTLKLPDDLEEQESEEASVNTSPETATIKTGADTTISNEKEKHRPTDSSDSIAAE